MALVLNQKPWPSSNQSAEPGLPANPAQPPHTTRCNLPWDSDHHPN